MKKKYVEPVMVVEDFTVSEMVAKNCGLIESELNITTQWSSPEQSANPCHGGFSDPKKDQAYNAFSVLFDEDFDLGVDQNNDGDKYNDTCFTQAIIDRTKNASHITHDICKYIPTETFNATTASQGFSCSSDSQLLQNS